MSNTVTSVTLLVLSVATILNSIGVYIALTR